MLKADLLIQQDPLFDSFPPCAKFHDEDKKHVVSDIIKDTENTTTRMCSSSKSLFQITGPGHSTRTSSILRSMSKLRSGSESMCFVPI